MTKKIPLRGLKFDKATVVEEYVDHNKWYSECICECGNTYKIISKYLKKNKHNSCGCKTPLAKDEVGNVYSRLTVLSKSQNTKQGDARFECKCECGEILIVAGKNLRSGHTTSCGCSMIKETLYYGQGLYTKGKYSTSVAGEPTKEFTLWVKMIERCYRPKFWENNPTYEKCEVSCNFKNFQFFAEWCNNQTGFNKSGWDLDKDIFGGTFYSENTCCFIPKEFNLFLATLKKRSDGLLPTGVTPRGGKFRAAITHKGKTSYLGTFLSAEEAHITYLDRKIDYFLKEIQLLENVLDSYVVAKLYLWLAEFKKSRAGSRPVSN